MIKIFNKIKNFIEDWNSAPLVFLLISGILIIGVIRYCENSKIVVPPSNPILNTDLKFELLFNSDPKELEEVPEVTEQEITEYIHKYFLRHNGILTQKIVKYGNTIHYEIRYPDIDRLYEKRNVELENEICILCEDIKNLWNTFGYEKGIRIAVLAQEDYERVYFQVEDGILTYSIFDEVKTETTKEDWIYLFEYKNGYTPTDAELNKFIQKEEKYLEEYFEVIEDENQDQEINTDGTDTDESSSI